MESGHWTATAYYVQYTKSLLDPQLFTTLGRLFSKCASAQILFSKNCKSVVRSLSFLSGA